MAFNSPDPDIFYDRIMHYPPPGAGPGPVGVPFLRPRPAVLCRWHPRARARLTSHPLGNKTGSVFPVVCLNYIDFPFQDP